jgi:hypothetical protein
MVHGVRRPGKTLSFSNLWTVYSSERLNDIVRHAGVQPNERDVFLTRVVTIAYTLMIEIRKLAQRLPPNNEAI